MSWMWKSAGQDFSADDASEHATSHGNSFEAKPFSQLVLGRDVQQGYRGVPGAKLANGIIRTPGARRVRSAYPICVRGMTREASHTLDQIRPRGASLASVGPRLQCRLPRPADDLCFALAGPLRHRRTDCSEWLVAKRANLKRCSNRE